jgi:hypothetical protein
VNPVFTELTNHHDFLPKLRSLDIGLAAWSPTVDASLVVDMLIWRYLTPKMARLQSFRFHSIYDHDLGKSLQSYIKAHPVYPELEALGTELETTSIAPFMNLA